MVLVDTSIWIDHLRFKEPQLERLLFTDQILMHPLVAGEVAMGSLQNRRQLLSYLDSLPEAFSGREEEVRLFVETERLFSRGIGYMDAHLLVAARLTPETSLWTRDKRLHELATELGLAFQETQPN